ncbi:hypothetical protein [Clostridium sp. BJN0001]|uniref:hypothetical protein n=1 Tax=Clostridium sp. BJN0001 TaxID=2930219 RepID=UPI001FD56490|nr:hypothetical protein [Clostridium sp. BJN0001]
MRNKALFITSFVLMIISLFFMAVNAFIFKIPDELIRICGIAIFINTPIFIYLLLRGNR